MAIFLEIMKTKRYTLLDTIRGITIISMILYHACWDIVYFGLGISPDFLSSRIAYVWQQSICYTFILLAGFCFCMGKHHVKRGLLSLGGGVVISIVTLLAVPEARDVFGVLWLIGSSILITIVIDKIIPQRKWFYAVGLIISLLLFVLFRNTNSGYMGFEGINLVELPSRLYKGYFMTFLGFMDPSFYSSDYFSLIPWFFLFTTGYFLNKMLECTRFFESTVLTKGIRPISFIGRHSLLIYMLHQVVLYGTMWLIFFLFVI